MEGLSAGLTCSSGETPLWPGQGALGCRPVPGGREAEATMARVAGASGRAPLSFRVVLRSGLWWLHLTPGRGAGALGAAVTWCSLGLPAPGALGCGVGG